MAWLASDFLSELRRAVGVASSSATSPEGLTDAELLPTVDREIQLGLVPVLLRCREEFLVLKSSVAISGTTTRIRVPSRAVAGRLRDIRQTINSQDRPLTRYEPEEKAKLFPNVAGAGSLCGYYLEGEWIVLIGTPSTSTLDLYFLARPGRMTVTAVDFKALTNVSGATLTYGAGTTFGATVDIVRGGSGLSALFIGLATSSVGATSLQVDAASAALIEIGDYVCSPDLCPVVPLPVELHSLLLSRATVAILRQLGKYDEAANEEKTAVRLEEVAVGLLTPRVESQPKVVVGNFHWRRRRGGRW